MTRGASLVVLACLLPTAAAHAADSPRACGDGGFSTRVVPLPIYATLPNEGDTYGFMPVFVRVCDEDERTRSIAAPSVTWNDVIHWTGTFRWYEYPSDEQSLTFIASLSTRINSGVFLQWKDLKQNVITNRVIRGGSYDSPAWNCRHAVRQYAFPTVRANTIGFRLCRDGK